VYVVLIGMSHKTAPLELRERLALDDAATLAVERDLLEQGHACEAVALSTCNRTEVYLYAGDSLAALQAAVGRLAEHAGVSAAELEPSVYSHSGDAAIAHLFRVAASLDSMVVGEAQIVAQLKSAYQKACDGGCTNVVFKIGRAHV
jgi:glutamyl-tRNA reductase